MVKIEPGLIVFSRSGVYDWPENTSLTCTGLCFQKLTESKVACAGDPMNEYMTSVSWPRICDACYQDLAIVQIPPCSYGPSPNVAKVCAAGDVCNTALLQAKSSCVGHTTFEKTMQHYVGLCGADEPAAATGGTATQAHSHLGFCGLVEAGCCGARPSATCPLEEGMEAIAGTCKAAESAPVCISCKFGLRIRLEGKG